VQPILNKLVIDQRPVHGILLIDKPLGLSSNSAIQKVKRMYRAQKAGHAGTLDPLATGLLSVCLGGATKFSQAGLNADKQYLATVSLGVVTDTGDAEGKILLRREVSVSDGEIRLACGRLTGLIHQVPPMYSAIKKCGKPLYEYARAGILIDRESREIYVHSVDIVNICQNTLILDIKCSKGTYIRTFAEDLGELLGCGAHLSGLQRTACGEMKLVSAVRLEDIATMSEIERDALLMDVDALIANWPIIRLSKEDAIFFMSGMRRKVLFSDIKNVRVYGPQEQEFLGAGFVEAGELIATRLLSPFEAQSLIQPVSQ
jgi:tRNA pseudouridine55 synthase